MPRKTFIQKSLHLTPEQWGVLEQLAADLGSLAPAGPRAGLPSWRTMVKDVSDGKLRIVAVKEKDDEKSLAG